MRVNEAKDFLVQQTAEQAALENVPLSDIEKRMMYFTETGECPEDPFALSDVFDAEHDTTAYEKKISLLMARAYRRIKRGSPKSCGHGTTRSALLEEATINYILVFWRQNAFRRSPRMWPTYLLAALAVASLYLLTFFFFFGNRRGIRRGEQSPIDRYIPTLSPLVQHTLQLLFLLALLFTILPHLFSRLAGFLQRFFQSTSSAQRQK